MILNSQPFTIWEAVLYGVLDSVPYMALILRSFRSRLRFGRGATFVLLAFVAVLQVAGNTVQLFAAPVQNSVYDAVLPLLNVVFVFLAFRDHIGKLVFSVLVLMDLGNLVVVLSKCLEGQLFPEAAFLRYHYTYSLVMLVVELLLLPVIYLAIFRDICTEGEDEAADAESAYMWRYLWLIPAIFYVIWMEHFYASGRSALENALDPVSTGYLLLIDAGSVLIYRIIEQLVRAQGNNRRLLAENYALTLQSVQYESLRKRVEEARRARHDLRHHLVLLRSIRDNRDFAALDELLARYPDQETLEQPLFYCKNETVNAVLAHFGAQAAEHGIRYSVKLDVPEDALVDKPDLAVLFGNLLENAVEACQHVEGDRFIAVSGGVSRSEARESLAFTVSNSSSAELQWGKNGELRSTKHGGDGIGSASVRSIAERYHGASAFSVQDGVFTASVVMFPKL